MRTYEEDKPLALPWRFTMVNWDCKHFDSGCMRDEDGHNEPIEPPVCLKLDIRGAGVACTDGIPCEGCTLSEPITDELYAIKYGDDNDIPF